MKRSALLLKDTQNRIALYSADTGRLRNSIAHAHDEDSAYIGSNVEYAPKIELNDMPHKNGKAHFLRDAAAQHGDEYKKLMETVLKS